MKKLILLCILSFMSSQMTFSQEYGWTDISANMPEQANLNDIHIIGEEVWIAGWEDGVFYSPDGGETFQIQAMPENSGITSSVFMKNNQEGYVVTFLGDILKTDNGGTTWTTLHEPSEGLNSVHFPPNSDTGYACGTNGTVYMFDDINITDISPAGVTVNLQSICFPTSNNDGKVCGEPTIARYMDNSWNNLQLYDNTFFYYSLFFINDITGWAVGTGGTIILTTDGISWVGQTSNTITSLYDVFFINSLEGWVAGSEILLHTIDGGITWTPDLESFTPGKVLVGVYFTSPNNGYVVGNYTVLKYGELSGTGSSIVKSLQFDIFPNPANHKIDIRSSEFSTENCSIEICDLNGRALIDKQIARGLQNVDIDVSNLSSGVYFCTLKTDKKSSTKKLIIE